MGPIKDIIFANRLSFLERYCMDSDFGVKMIVFVIPSLQSFLYNLHVVTSYYDVSIII